MAISQEIMVYMLGVGFATFIIILFLIRMSNAIVSRRFQENNERMIHLEKIARNHSMLRMKVEELEKKFEKKEILETTQEMIARAIEQERKRK